MDILKHGSGVEIIAPKDLKQKIKLKLLKAKNIYKN